MKLQTHAMAAGLASLWVCQNPVESALLCFGSLLPDADSFFGLKHRGITHNFLIYLILIPIYPFYFVAAGCLLHILMDSVTFSGVPILPKIRIIKNGDRKEFAFFVILMISTGISFFFKLLNISRGFLCQF